MKRHFKYTGESLHVHTYKFAKVHGTRFIGHQFKGLTNLLHNWIVLAQALEVESALTEYTKSRRKIKMDESNFGSLCESRKRKRFSSDDDSSTVEISDEESSSSGSDRDPSDSDYDFELAPVSYITVEHIDID